MMISIIILVNSFYKQMIMIFFNARVHVFMVLAALHISMV